MNTSIKLIDEPRAKSRLRKVTEAGITGMAWGIWVYLLMPMVSLLAWLLTGEIIFNNLFYEDGLASFTGLMKQMGYIVIIIIIVISGWSYYNFFRFGKKNRRKSMRLGQEEMRLLAEFHQMDQKLLNRLLDQKEIVWPPLENSEIEAGAWIDRKNRKLAGYKVEDSLDDHSIHLTRLHEIRPVGEPSIAFSIAVVVISIYVAALLIVLFVL